MEQTSLEQINKNGRLQLTTDIVSAYVSNNPVPIAELPALIGRIHASLEALAKTASAPGVPDQRPAVPIKKSVTDNYIVCLEDGKKFKSLKRHLTSHYGMTPDEYRAKWGLPYDYPMVAPNYAAARSELAKKMGLGKTRAVESAPRSSARRSARTV